MVAWAAMLVKRYYYVVLHSNDEHSTFEWKFGARPVLERVEREGKSKAGPFDESRPKGCATREVLSPAKDVPRAN